MREVADFDGALAQLNEAQAGLDANTEASLVLLAVKAANAVKVTMSLCEAVDA
jgi:hypothetical protein